jgi:hypothetical protein
MYVPQKSHSPTAPKLRAFSAFFVPQKSHKKWMGLSAGERMMEKRCEWRCKSDFEEEKKQ